MFLDSEEAGSEEDEDVLLGMRVSFVFVMTLICSSFLFACRTSTEYMIVTYRIQIMPDNVRISGWLFDNNHFN